ncbi:MAG: LapA family protein [Thermomicrobiales bacterium]
MIDESERTERTIPRESRQQTVAGEARPQTVPLESVTERHKGFQWTPKLVIWTILLIAALIFLLQNFDDVRINLLFWDYTLPLALIVGICFVLGYVLGWIRPVFRAHRRS